MFPVDPENLASPKAKIPPSDATIQQPDGDAAAAVPTAAARPSVAWAGPVTDPAKLRKPARRAPVRNAMLKRLDIVDPPGRWLISTSRGWRRRRWAWPAGCRRVNRRTP